MIEVFGDLWTYPADAICITTNGTVKKNGEVVMGKGCAYEATKRIPKIALKLGSLIGHKGNQVYVVNNDEPWLISFPVKHNWWETADIELIEKSACELVSWTNFYGWDSVVLPRPGCGNGKLAWDDVKGVIAPILDDRFKVITHG